MGSLQQFVGYGPFIGKIECANHPCKCSHSGLKTLVKDHPEFRGKGGLTKRVIQRLTIEGLQLHNRFQASAMLEDN